MHPPWTRAPGCGCRDRSSAVPIEVAKLCSFNDIPHLVWGLANPPSDTITLSFLDEETPEWLQAGRKTAQFKTRSMPPSKTASVVPKTVCPKVLEPPTA